MTLNGCVLCGCQRCRGRWTWCGRGGAADTKVGAPVRARGLVQPANEWSSGDEQEHAPPALRCPQREARVRCRRSGGGGGGFSARSLVLHRGLALSCELLDDVHDTQKGHASAQSARDLGGEGPRRLGGQGVLRRGSQRLRRALEDRECPERLHARAVGRCARMAGASMAGRGKRGRRRPRLLRACQRKSGLRGSGGTAVGRRVAAPSGAPIGVHGAGRAVGGRKALQRGRVRRGRVRRGGDRMRGRLPGLSAVHGGHAHAARGWRKAAVEHGRDRQARFRRWREMRRVGFAAHPAAHPAARRATQPSASVAPCGPGGRRTI